ncbi:MAG: C45 family autoproteolytic acyltransferase/hydrolase [Flavobacterium sp.]
MSTKLKYGSSYQKNGWKYISIHGKPRERGNAYGQLCVDDFKEIQTMLHFLMMEAYGQTWDFFIEAISRDFKPMTKRRFPELYEEMSGIAEGLNQRGCRTTLDEILAWNFYCSIPYWYQTVSESHMPKEGGRGSDDKCSAFMAVGDWTADGGIVCAHNSFTDYIDGQYSNIILDIQPDKGHRMIMQTSPCWIWSGTDFFVTSKGIIGTETTIGGFIPYEKRYPIGYRIRKAMQYGNTLDDYCRILLHENSGDYANSWLFGDTHTNEILRIELGLKYHNIERTKNGYFIGFNAPYDERIRNLEVNNSGFYDIRRHQGARMVRLGDLMDKHKGKLNIHLAKQIIGDHYDVYLEKDDHPCSRTVCSHYDLDAREYMSQESRPKPYAPRGAVDGIVCDSALAKRMAFIGKFGSSCDIPFDKERFCKQHRQYEKFCPYLKDRPSYPWTEFSVGGKHVNTRRRRHKKHNRTRRRRL